MTETAGKRIAKIIMSRCLGADAFHRRWDNLVLLDKQPVARLVLAGDGPPSILWNQAELTRRQLDKDDLLQELARAGPPSAALVAWTS